MDIRVLRYFLAVAREGNITRAAESLHIAQPSLSKQLMELESELGRKLLIRGRRKVTLTEEGILLRRRAEELVALMEKTERELSADRDVLSGEVAIGGMPGRTVLRAAAQLRAEHPEVRFRFYSSDAEEVMERLDHGSLDFAVLLEPVDTEKYAYLSLDGADRWGLLMDAACPLAARPVVEREDLLTVPLIVHRRAGLQRELKHWARTGIEHMHIAATYNVVNGDPAVYVRSGLGCLATTGAHLTERLEPGLCFRPLEPPLELRHALVWKRSGVLSRSAEEFLKNLTKIAELPAP